MTDSSEHHLKGHRRVLDVFSFLLVALCGFAAISACGLFERERSELSLAGALARIRADVEFLARAELEGRGAGTRGGDIAASYIASEFAKLGLVPCGGEGSYFQEFDIVLRRLGADNSLVTYVHGEEMLETTAWRLGVAYLPISFSGAGDAQGKAVVIRLAESRTAFPQIPDEALRGKVPILILNGAGQSFGSQRDELWNAVLCIQRKGARGVLVMMGKDSEASGGEESRPDSRRLESPFTAWPDYLPARLGARLAPDTARKHAYTRESLATSAQARALRALEKSPSIPCALVCRDFVDDVLDCAGTSLEKFLIEAQSGPDFAMLDITDVEVALRVSIGEEKVTSRNVLGLVRGSDEALREELVVVGAHYDHLGVGPGGHIFPGANDDASGVAALLEIARRLSLEDAPLMRSVLFAAFGGEELGLWGSRACANSPLVVSEVCALVETEARCERMPARISRAVAMLNMDMLGRGAVDELYVIGVLRNPDLFGIVSKENASIGFNLKSDIEFAFDFGSDHFAFHEVRVPSLDFTSSMFPDHHTKDDTTERICVEKIARSTGLVLRVVRNVANREDGFPAPLEVEVPFPWDSAE